MYLSRRYFTRNLSIGSERGVSTCRPGVALLGRILAPARKDVIAADVVPRVLVWCFPMKKAPCFLRYACD